MNFFDVKSVPGGVRLADGTVLPVPARFGAVVEGRDLTLGLRPENLAPDNQGLMSGRIKAIEPTGLDTYVALDIAGHDTMIVVKERMTAAPGSILRLSADYQRAHLFGPDGLAL